MNIYDLIARTTLIGLILLAIACPICSAIVAATKQRDAMSWFILGLLFGPFGLLAAVGASMLEPVAIRDARRGSSRKVRLCPHCIEPASAAASVCPHCTQLLDSSANPSAV